MKLIIKSFFEVFDVLKKDKIIILFSLLPIIIGIILFSLLGTMIYTDGLAWGESIINDYISGESWNAVIHYTLIAIVTAGLYFLLSLAFVLIVSVIASPFNDILSERTEALIKGQKSQNLGSSLKKMIGDFFTTIVNEIKKISLIIILSCLALGLSFIPFLIPVGILISSMLVAINFLDYSWSRDSFRLSACINDYKKSFWTFTISGGLFLVIITIPLVNLLVLPFGVIFFTVLQVRGSLNE